MFENESHLCRRFTVFVTKYNLMSKVGTGYRDQIHLHLLAEPQFTKSLPRTSSPDPLTILTTWSQDNLIVPMLEQEALGTGESEA